MGKGRLEAFSDGVVAIIITIMVLELKTPHGTDWTAIRPFLPALGTYVLSYVFIGIYWSNHHHMLHATDRVNGTILWANLHLLFWLSLVPFVTGWLSENHFAKLPAAVYGFVLLMAGVAYQILERAIVRLHGPGSRVHRALGVDVKAAFSTAAYVCAIPLAFVDTRIAFAIYILIAAIWFIPDPRIEKVTP